MTTRSTKHEHYHYLSRLELTVVMSLAINFQWRLVALFECFTNHQANGHVHMCTRYQMYNYYNYVAIAMPLVLLYLHIQLQKFNKWFYDLPVLYLFESLNCKEAILKYYIPLVATSDIASTNASDTADTSSSYCWY